MKAAWGKSLNCKRFEFRVVQILHMMPKLTKLVAELESWPYWEEDLPLLFPAINN